MAGVHEYDDRLQHFTPDAVAGEISRSRHYLNALSALPEADLTADERVDRALCLSHLEDEIQTLEIDRPTEKKPDLYADEGVYGCFALVARNFAPAEQRAEALLGRMAEIPRVLAGGRQNLRHPAPVHLEVTMSAVAGGIRFFQNMIPAFAAQVPALDPQLQKAAATAAQSLQEYLDFLRHDVQPRANGDFALGRERFDWKLKNFYLLPYDAQSLHERGHELVREAQAELQALARRIDPLSDWKEIIHRIKQNTPTAPALVDTYGTVLADARRFCVDRGLVPLPPGEQLRLEETPYFLRPTIAYAAYVQPGPFEPEVDGLFFVTPVNQDAPPATQAAQLSGHSLPAIKITVLHEAYPGHHLQLSWAIRHPSLVRKLLGNILFMEGWTLYCEQLMVEQGWLGTPEEHLIQLKDQLWRACRVVVDSGLHALGMGIDEAVGIMQDIAALEEPAARTEVRGYYCNSPTVPMSYLIGKQELLRLKADYQRAKGADFSLYQFHSDLLSHGSIPFAHVRSLMLPST